MSNADYKLESAFVTVWSLHYFTNTVAFPPQKKGKHVASRPGERLIMTSSRDRSVSVTLLVGKVGFVFVSVLLFTTVLHKWTFPATTPFPSLSPCCLLLLGFRFIVSSWQGILELISDPLALPSVNFFQNDSRCLILNRP